MIRDRLRINWMLSLSEEKRRMMHSFVLPFRSRILAVILVLVLALFGLARRNPE